MTPDAPLPEFLDSIADSIEVSFVGAIRSWEALMGTPAMITRLARALGSEFARYSDAMETLPVDGLPPAAIEFIEGLKAVARFTLDSQPRIIS